MPFAEQIACQHMVHLLAGRYANIMKRLLFFILICASSYCLSQGGMETNSFRVHLHEFFNNSAYQRSHIKFPYQHVHYESEQESTKLVTELKSESDWVFMQGPEHYRCGQSCADLMIYDSFEMKQKLSGERVLALEGVENGIRELLFFQLINNEWYLVKHESLSD